MKQTLKILAPLAVVFALLVATNFIYAGWDKPSAGNAPAQNVDAPINVGGVNQGKSALLTVLQSRILAYIPILHFSDLDSGQNDWRIIVDSSIMVFSRLTNANAWVGKLSLTDTYARFAGQVRATEYCDQDGNNCGLSGGEIRECLDGQILMRDAGSWVCWDIEPTVVNEPEPSWRFVSLDVGMQKAAARVDFIADMGGSYSEVSKFYATDATAEKICDLYAGDDSASQTGYSVTSFSSPIDNWTNIYDGTVWSKIKSNLPMSCTSYIHQCNDHELCIGTEVRNRCSSTGEFNSLISSLNCKIPN